MRLEFAGSDPGRCCIGMPWILARRRLQEPSRMRLRRKTQRNHSWARNRPAKRSCPIWSLSGKRYSFLEPSPSHTTLARTVRQKASAPATPVSPTTTLPAEMPGDLRRPMQKQPGAQLENSPKRTSSGLRRGKTTCYHADEPRRVSHRGTGGEWMEAIKLDEARGINSEGKLSVYSFLHRQDFPSPKQTECMTMQIPLSARQPWNTSVASLANPAVTQETCSSVEEALGARGTSSPTLT